MFVLSHQLQHLPVLATDSLRPVAKLDTPVIYHPELAIVAFWCQQVQHLKPVILAQDIKRLTSKGLVIRSTDDLVDPTEIVRLEPILATRFRLAGVQVVNESGTKLGKVEEYVINLDNLLVQKLHVRQSPVKNFLLNRLVVDRSQVVEVTPKRLTIRDATVKDSLLAAKPVVPD